MAKIRTLGISQHMNVQPKRMENSLLPQKVSDSMNGWVCMVHSCWVVCVEQIFGTDQCPLS